VVYNGKITFFLSLKKSDNIIIKKKKIKINKNKKWINK